MGENPLSQPYQSFYSDSLEVFKARMLRERRIKRGDRVSQVKFIEELFRVSA